MTGGAGAPGRRMRRPALTAIGSVLLATLLFATGCATVRAPTAGDSGPRNEWQGRFAAQTREEGLEPKVETASGRFALSRHGGLLELTLSSPLGQVLATATARPGHASLRLSDGSVREAVDVEELTAREFGWRLPVTRLTDWLEGIADGPAQRDAQGRLTGAVDSNWRLTVTDWTGQRPRRLELNWPVTPPRPGEPLREIRLRLAVDD